MPEPFFVSGPARADKVHELFAGIAQRYDLINDLQSFGLHRAWKRRVIQLAQVKPGERALDLCCGTGDLALTLAQAGAETIGLDFTAEMLDVANRRKSELHQNGVTFLCGDAQQVPFAERSFDIVTVGYGLRNLADWTKGLSEMERVAKPGGRLLVLDFGKPQNWVCRHLYFGYLRLVVPLLGRVFCRNAAAYAYILESLRHYPAQQGVAEQMRQLGLSEVRVIELLGGVMSINCGVRKRET